MRRVEFYDGEADDPADDNMVGQLADRHLARYLLRPMIEAGAAHIPTTTLRLVRGAGFLLSGTGNRTINLADGYYAQGVAPATADDPDVVTGEYGAAAYVLDANTSGAVYRRDILQARIDAESTTGSESRDFEDAATRALSTQSFDKRRVRTVTISVKKGADQVSEALANANEPAPDAGYTKIYSFLVDNTGAVAEAKVWDWHTPVGSQFINVDACDFAASNGTPTLRGSSATPGPRWNVPNGSLMDLYGRSQRIRWSLARLVAIRPIYTARDGGSNLIFELREPTGSTALEVLTAALTADIALNNTTITTFVNGPVWWSSARNRGLSGFPPTVKLPPFVRWRDQGTATGDAELYAVELVWAGY